MLKRVRNSLARFHTYIQDPEIHIDESYFLHAPCLCLRKKARNLKFHESRITSSLVAVGNKDLVSPCREIQVLFLFLFRDVVIYMSNGCVPLGTSMDRMNMKERIRYIQTIPRKHFTCSWLPKAARRQRLRGNGIR